MSVDGNVKITLGLKATALDVADNSSENVTYNDFTKIYYVKGANAETLKSKGFEFYQYNSKQKPIYKKEDIFAEVDTSSAEEQVFIYRSNNLKWREEE